MTNYKDMIFLGQGKSIGARDGNGFWFFSGNAKGVLTKNIAYQYC